MTVVRHTHLRQAGICMGGARRFWARHELDWNDFLDNGIDGSRLLATGDAQARRVVELANG